MYTNGYTQNFWPIHSYQCEIAPIFQSQSFSGSRRTSRLKCYESILDFSCCPKAVIMAIKLSWIKYPRFLKALLHLGPSQLLILERRTFLFLFQLLSDKDKESQRNSGPFDSPLMWQKIDLGSRTVTSSMNTLYRRRNKNHSQRTWSWPALKQIPQPAHAAPICNGSLDKKVGGMRID